MEADGVEARLAGVERVLGEVRLELRLVARRQAALDERLRDILAELRALAAYPPTEPPGE